MKRVYYFFFMLSMLIGFKHRSLQAEFNFDAFFDSLFDDEEESSGVKSEGNEILSQPVVTAQKSHLVDTVEQSVSVKKKENFLKSLRFTPTDDAKKNDKEIVVKVPESKRKAFLYYTQKLLDFIFLIKQSFDVSMREEVRDFLSIGDSIVSAVLSIDKQYLLRTFYHQDFEELRKKIYNTLTKKISQESLRSLMIDLQNRAQKAIQNNNNDDDDDRLVFERDRSISFDDRKKFLEDVYTVTEKDLKPIFEDLQKIFVHSYAVEQKKKKTTERTKKSQVLSNRTASSGASWRPLRSSSSGGRSEPYRPRGGYGGYGGYSGGSGGPGYSSRSDYGAVPSSDPTRSTQPSSSTTSTMPKVEEKKEEAAKTNGQALLEMMQQVFDGFGKEITTAIKALDVLPAVNDQKGKRGEEYLFNTHLKIVLSHDRIEKYFELLEKINSLYVVMKVKGKGSVPKSGSIVAEGGKEDRLTQEHEVLFGRIQALKKQFLIPLARVRNAFCYFEKKVYLPAALVPLVTFDVVKRQVFFEKIYADICTLYKKEVIKKNEKLLEQQIKSYDTYSKQQFEAILLYSQKYAECLGEYNPVSGTEEEKKKKDEELSKLLLEPDFILIAHDIGFLKKFPHPLICKDITGSESDWVLDAEHEKKFFKYIKSIDVLLWVLQVKYYDLFVIEKPTRNMLYTFKDLQEKIEKYVVSSALVDKVRVLLERVRDENNKNAHIKGRLEEILARFDVRTMESVIHAKWNIKKVEGRVVGDGGEGLGGGIDPLNDLRVDDASRLEDEPGEG